jgi:hypothetical protein
MNTYQMENKTALQLVIEQIEKRLYTVENEATQSESAVIISTVLRVCLEDLRAGLPIEKQQIVEAVNESLRAEHLFYEEDMPPAMRGEEYYNSKYGQ